MPEETLVVDEKQTQTTPSPFGKDVWTETLPELKKEETNSSATTTTTGQSAADTESKTPLEIVEPKEWLKKEFDIEDASILKAEREELRTLKAQVPAEIKFENEQSKILHELLREGKTKEVREFLETQEKLQSLTTIEVNKNTAEDIIKLGMQLKYKDLSSTEINYKYNREFGLPKEPVYDDTKETEPEFEARRTEWQEKVNDIEMQKMIEAKLSRPELEKLKAELKLPEVTKNTSPAAHEPDQKELDKLKVLQENFVKVLESDYKNFNGFETRYKDEEVDIPVSFLSNEEEKVALRKELETFNVESFFISRWFDEKGTPKVTQMMEDITLLRKKEAVLQKVATEVGSKMKEHYIKLKSNINVNGSSSETFQPSQNGQSNASPFSKDAWSETPKPVLN